jgi:hypothetical protein
VQACDERLGHQPASCGARAVGKHRTAFSKQVSHEGFAPASTLLHSLKGCAIANQRSLLATTKMLHWLAGAKQPEGTGKHVPRNIEIIACTVD